MKRLIASILTASMLLTLLVGCKSQDAMNGEKLINEGQPIKIEVRVPSAFSISTRGSVLPQSEERLPLEKENTYSNGFRQNFDTVFNINTIRDAVSGDGKQGCLYVKSLDGNDVRSGSTCLKDAFRNKKFIENYWQDSDTQNRLLQLGADLYTDMDVNNQISVYAAFNAYYNLIPDAVDPVAFNPTQTLTREQFYSFLYRAMNGDTNIVHEPSADMFVQLVGVDTPDTKYAKQVEQYGWLRMENKSLDINTINDKITRAEAIYMVVTMCFPDIYEQMADGSPSFNDAKSNGDLAAKLNYKLDDGTGKDRWQAFVLAYMVRNPDKGMQSELYRATAAAKALNLVTSTDCRWNESLAKFEALDLVIRALRKMNEQYGYETSVEYATIEAPVELPKPQIPAVMADRISRLTDVQIGYFKEAAEMYQEEVENNKLTEAQANQKRIEYLNDTIGGTLMMLVVDLFPYWQYVNGYVDEFPDMSIGQGSLAGEIVGEEDEEIGNQDENQDETQNETQDGDENGTTDDSATDNIESDSKESE